jgi:hypothetical protein
MIVVHIQCGRRSAVVSRLDRMKARGKKLKRKRGPSMSFGDLGTVVLKRIKNTTWEKYGTEGRETN